MHILLTCCFAREVWTDLGMQQVAAVMRNDTSMNIFKSVFRTGTKEQCVMLGMFS